MLCNSPLIYSAEALIPYNEGVKDTLTKIDKFGGEYTMFRRDAPDSPNVWVPRGYSSRVGAKSIFVSDGDPVKMPTTWVPPQTAEQQACINSSLALLQTHVDHVVEAPTGFGKSYLGCAVAARLGKKTLIVVTKNDLVKSWQDTLINLFGMMPHQIGHIQQKVQKYKDCPFTVAMIHSLICREYDPEMYRSFGLVIFDEVHRLGAEYFSQACKLFPSSHRLGLSATPKRSDGREKLFEGHIGPTMVRGTWVPMKAKILVKKTGWKVPNVPQRDEMGSWHTGPMEIVPGSMMNATKAIASDKVRNHEIGQFVRAAYDSGRHTVVMSDLVDSHLLPLFHILVSHGIPGQDIGYYHGSVPKGELDSQKMKKVVLATYAMCGEGTNVPHWDTLVLATPRANVKQAVGRVLRFVQGKKQPVVLELVDDHPILKGFHMSRLTQYYSIGAEVVEV